MKLTSFALVPCVAVVALVACSSDPAAEGIGDPFRIVTSASQIHIDLGGEAAITAFVIDDTNRRIPGALTANPAASAVTLDSVIYDAALAETRIFARAAGESPTGTDITVAGHNLSTTVTVIVE